MSKSYVLIKTTIIYFIGNFASKLLGFVLLPLYTVYLTSADYGTIDLLMSTLPLIAPIFTMQVTEAVFRFLMTDKTHLHKQITISNSLLIFGFGILVFSLLYLPLLHRYSFDYGLLFIIYFIVTYIGIFLQQVLRGLGKPVEYAITGIISTIVHASLNIFLLVKIGLGGNSLLISSISGSLVISIYMLIRTKLWMYINFNTISKIEIKKQLIFGLPLIPNQIAWWIIGLLGKYILIYFHNVADNGILAVANKFPNILAIVNMIFLKAWTENIIKEYQYDNKDIFFNKNLKKFTIFTLSVAACLLPIIKIYNILTIKGDFGAAWMFVPILLIGCSFNSLATFLGSLYTASLKTKQALSTTVVSAVSNLILSLILIPVLSIWGVVISNMISFIILYIVRIRSIKNIIALKIDFKSMIYCCYLLLFSLIIYYSFDIYGQLLSIIIVGLGAFYLNRSIFFSLFNYVARVRNK